MINPKSRLARVSASVGGFKRLRIAVNRHIVSSIMTTLLLGALGVVQQSVQEGGLRQELWVLLTSKAERAREEQNKRAEWLQGELRAVESADMIIHDTLSLLLAAGDGAVRARTGIIHNGVMTVTNRGLLKYDITNGVAAPGESVGPMSMNQPLAEWSAYMAAFIEGKCVFVHSAAFTETSATVKAKELDIIAVLACPLREPNGHLFGGLFVHWGSEAQIPQDIGPVMSRVEDAALRISTAWSLRPRVRE